MQFISPNELLTARPPVIYERLAPRLQRVRLKVGSILFDVGATIDYTWFISSGIVSLLGVTEDGASVEVAMAGRDSVIGFPGIVRKNGAAFRAQAPIAGEAQRVSARDLQAAIKQESQIYLPLLDHTHTLSEQIAQATVCNQFHTADQRLARWLLLARQDALWRFRSNTRGDGADTGCIAQRRQLGGGLATNEGTDPLCAWPDHPPQSQRT
jgi:CRP-like cAMP-binding protein